MNLYIHSTGILSAAGNNADENFMRVFPHYETDKLLCKEPDYSSYIPAIQLRRMSKAVRMSIGAAKICLEKAGKKKPDAISVGSAFGALNDTEIFLSKMTQQDEQMLTPTAFIQSTHNTVSGQIALITGCHGNNMTFAHRAHSLEHALLYAQLYLDNHPQENVLAGGYDELTETSLDILQQTGVYRKTKSTPESMLRNHETGSLAGEGAAFFLVSKEEKTGSLLLKDIVCFTEVEAQRAPDKVSMFMQKHNLNETDIDLVMPGINGDRRSEGFYKMIREKFRCVSQGGFKHLCGEYPTSVGFAVGIAVQAAQGILPDAAILNHPPEKLKNIIIINNFLHHYSCLYLTCA